MYAPRLPVKAARSATVQKPAEPRVHANVPVVGARHDFARVSLGQAGLRGKSAQPTPHVAAMQRMPIVPDGMMPAHHLLANSPADAYTDFLASFVLVPKAVLTAFADRVSNDELAAEMVLFSTLIALLVHVSPGDAAAVNTYNTTAAGEAKLAALTQVAARIDTVLGAHLHDRMAADVVNADRAEAQRLREEAERLRKQQQTVTVNLGKTHLTVGFHHALTKRDCTIRASMQRHGLWNLTEAVPKEKNSVLVPSVIGQLESDGRELGIMLSARKKDPWFGAGSLFKVSSGRVYEVDLATHFFPVDGPGVVPLNQDQYLAVRAIIDLFHSNEGNRVRAAISGEALFAQIPFEPWVTTLVAQLRQAKIAPDATVDKLIFDHVKPYKAKSITGVLAEFVTVFSSWREDVLVKEKALKASKKAAASKAEKPSSM